MLYIYDYVDIQNNVDIVNELKIRKYKNSKSVIVGFLHNFVHSTRRLKIIPFSPVNFERQLTPFEVLFFKSVDVNTVIIFLSFVLKFPHIQRTVDGVRRR